MFDVRELANNLTDAEARGPEGPRASRVETDSRAELDGALFLALKGERFDGHDFIDDALTSGAAALCVSAEFAKSSGLDFPVPTLVVPDTSKALLEMAAYHRRRYPSATIIGVTGSSGKTSVKEMIRSILETAFGADAVLATRGNTNNQIGLPMNLLRLSPKHRFAVVEMGTNQPGEIEILADVAAPDIAVITSVGNAHLELLGGLEGVAKEKSAIFRSREFDGSTKTPKAVMPAACPGLEILKNAALDATYSFGFESADANANVERFDGGFDGAEFTISVAADGKRHAFDVAWHIPGRHQAGNAAAAAMVAVIVGAGDSIPGGLAACELPGMRMRSAEIAEVKWINDAYNANPDSVRAALALLAEFADSPKTIVVLGDMLELGAQSAALHREVLEFGFDNLRTAGFLLVGPNMTTAAESLPSGQGRYKAFADSEELREYFYANPPSPGTTIFLKASRGMALERCVPEPEE